jgi:DNA-binding MarR family transcriptional regulator
MNYLKQLKGFWAKAETSDLSSNEISIYMTLLHLNNNLGWISPFICHYFQVCQIARISKDAYYRNMDSLTAKGFINFKKGEKNKRSPKVTILSLENKKGTMLVQGAEQELEQDDELSSEQRENLYKQLNFKTIKLLNNNVNLINKNLEEWIKAYTNQNQVIKNETTSNSENQTIKQWDSKSLEKYISELNNDNDLELFNRKRLLITDKQYQQLIETFTNLTKVNKVVYKDYSQIATHFNNWILKNKEKYVANTVFKSNGKLPVINKPNKYE